MGDFEKSAVKAVWRVLKCHVKGGHRLEVRRLPESDDLEIHCLWCGRPVMLGSLEVVGLVARNLQVRGAKITGVPRLVERVG